MNTYTTTRGTEVTRMTSKEAGLKAPCEGWVKKAPVFMCADNCYNNCKQLVSEVYGVCAQCLAN